jgi:hypothetical protein
MIIRCKQAGYIAEFIPSNVLKQDLPWNLIDSNHHWYIESSRTIEIRPEQKTWSRDEPRVWKASLNVANSKVSGECTKLLAQGLCRLVDPHSQLYRHLGVILLPLEPQHDGIVVTVEANDHANHPTIYLPRHDLTFYLTSSSLLECQSFPGLVIDTNYRGIGTLIGLRTVISLRSNDRLSQRKILIPKGALSSAQGTYGHPLTSIDLKEARGYFVYEVDEVLGRLHGTRSIESDLFLAYLHALTSASLPDPLTQRAGTHEALQCLTNSSCYSAYSLSFEARSYLDGLASLSPRRTFYPPHLQVMETVRWNSSLPALSQHPSFYPLVENILKYWRDLGDFHSFGDLLDPVESTSGMDHLSARANTRNWAYQYSSHTTQSLKDLVHRPHDSIHDEPSRNRERIAFEVAYLSHSSTNSFPLCRTLRATVMLWKEIQGKGQWKCKDIHHWLPKANSMGEIWCTLYELCRVATWSANFELTMMLSLLGYCKAPFEILATLMAVAWRPKIAIPQLQFYPRLDLTLGSDFDQARLRQVLTSYAIGFEKSEESKIQNESWGTKAERKQRAREVYGTHLKQEVNETIAELRSQWPNLPEELRISNRRLLKPPINFKSALRSILLGFVQNRIFLQRIDNVSAILSPFYISRTVHESYIPRLEQPSKLSIQFTIPTMKDLMNSKSLNNTTLNLASQAETSNSLSFRFQDTSSLNNLFDDLSRLAQTDLESHYLQNLRESIDALARHTTLNGYTTVPPLDSLYSVHQSTKEVLVTETSCLQEALLPHDCASKLLVTVGLLPPITPISLLQQLSLINRKTLSKHWESRLIQYAVKLHDAKRAERMVRLFDTKRYSHLLVELQYHREWDPFVYVDWLLVEIDTNLSIRPEQADIAKEMIHPSNNQNLVMQLNMGEGKSSVSLYIYTSSSLDAY